MLRMPDIQLTTSQIDRLVSLLDEYDDYDDIIDTILNQVPLPVSDQRITTSNVWLYQDHLFPGRTCRTLADALNQEGPTSSYFKDKVWLIGKVPGDDRMLCFGWDTLSHAKKRTEVVRRDFDPERNITGYYSSWFDVYRENLADLQAYLEEHK